MVKIGFIVEGPSDAKIVRSENFLSLMVDNNIEIVDIIVPEGKTHFFHPKGNIEIIQEKVDSYIRILEDKGAERIFFLVDLDTEPCFTSVKSKIPHRANDPIIVCKRALEAWYLADSEMMSSLLKEKYICENPEEINDPFLELKNLLLEKTERGVGDKIILANKVLKEGFTLTKAAQHQNCLSAKYFIASLQSLHN